MQQVAQTLIKDPRTWPPLSHHRRSEHGRKRHEEERLNAASKALQVLTADQRAKLGDALATMSANARAPPRALSADVAGTFGPALAGPNRLFMSMEIAIERLMFARMDVQANSTIPAGRWIRWSCAPLTR